MTHLISKYNLKAKNRRSVIALLSVCLPAITFSSCSGDTPYPEEDYDGFEINIAAGIARELYSRAPEDDMPEGEVTEGTYYLSYPAAKPVDGMEYGMGTVEFGTDPSNPGMGIVALPSEDPFKWKEIKSGTPTFYLDNVKPTDIEGEKANGVVYFDETDNPYKAGFYNPPSNDLLWGNVQVSHNTVKTLNFDLHHNMARVLVEITVDKTNDTETGDLDLRDAVVEITNINADPVSFNRLDGTLALNPEAELQNLRFADKNHQMTEQSLTEESDNKVFIYTTESCVLPPQGLLEDDKRPRLEITLKNGTRYSGILPTAMEIENTVGSNPIPVALYFLKEHILTIRTVISEDPPTLLFMPVKVVEWVDKGHFTLEGHQSGIYTANELITMIGYYNANNEYQLERYGKIITEDTTSLWQFDVFRSFTINFDDIYGKINGNNADRKDFIFFFNLYSVTVTKNGVGINVTPDQLKEILWGRYNPFS